MKKKITVLFSVILVVILVSAGYTYLHKDNIKLSNNSVENNMNEKFKSYYNGRVQYVGNNSEVIHLLNLLGVGDLGKYTITMKTDKKPYALTIDYSQLKNKSDEDKFKIMDRIDYAYFALALIDNLNDVYVNYKTYSYHLTKEQANKLVNGNIKDYGSSPEELKVLYNKLNLKDVK